MEFIGKKIKRRRLSKKYSLDYVSSELKITKETLKDIENDNFISINKDVFLIGHIRSYSNFLELNSKEVIEEFKLQNAYKKIDIKEQIPKPLTYNSFNIKGFLSFASIIFIFAIFYYLFVDGETPSPEYALVPDIPVSLDPIVEKTTIKEALNKKENNENLYNLEENNVSTTSVLASQNSNTTNDKDSDITLKFINPTWIQIRDSSDNIIFSKLMNKNDEYTYKLSANYFLTSGNAGNIIVSINSEIRGKVGGFGEVVDSVSIDSNFSN